MLYRRKTSTWYEIRNSYRSGTERLLVIEKVKIKMAYHTSIKKGDNMQGVSCWNPKLMIVYWDY